MGPGRRNSASLCLLKYDILKIWSPNMKLWDRIHVSLSFCGSIYFNLCPYFFKTTCYIVFPPHCYQFASLFTILYVCKVPGHGTFWFSSQRWPKCVFTHTFSLGRRTRIVCVTVSRSRLMIIFPNSKYTWKWDQGSRLGRRGDLISETERRTEKRKCSLHSTFSFEEEGIIKLETIISH